MIDEDVYDTRDYSAECPQCHQKCPEEDILEFGRCFPCDFEDPANDDKYSVHKAE